MTEQRTNIFSSLHLYTLIVALLLGLLAVAITRSAYAFNGDYALDFGGSDYVVLAETANVLDSGWEDTKTVSLWMRPTANFNCTQPNDPGHCALVVGDRPRWWGIAFGDLGIGTDRIWVWNNEVDGGKNMIGVEYTLGEWVHITLVHNNGTLTAYKNGVEVDSVTSGATEQPPALPELNIGGMIKNEDSIWTFEGQIEEVRFWDTARSSTEVRQDMYRTLAGSETGLAAYYRMSDGSGTTLTDDSGNGWNGTFTGAPAWVASGAFTGPRHALDFDGTDDTVTVPDDISLDATSNMTIELWANPDNWANGSNTPFLTKGDGTIPQLNYYVGKADTDELRFAYESTSSVEVLDTSGAAFSNGTWYHLAFVVDVASDEVRFYRNGVLLSAVANNFMTNPLVVNADALTLAQYPNAATLFDGRLDEVRIWNGARTAAEIRNNMFQTLAGDESGLVAYYRFDQDNEAGQTTLDDVTANGNHGTLTNMDPASDWVSSTAFTTWIGGDSADWSTGGNWSGYAVPGSTDNVGIYSYSGSNTPTLPAGATVDKLVVATDASLQVGSSGSLSVNDRLFNYGSLQQTQDVSGSSDVTFFATGGYGGVTLNANGTALGVTTVTIDGNQDCTSVTGETVRRCFDVTPTNTSGLNATVTFSFADEELLGHTCSNLDVFHWQAGAWTPLTLDTTYGTNGRICSGTPYSLRVTGVTDFSPFVLDVDAPTAIALNGITASPAGSLLPILLALSLLTLSTTELTLLWRKRRQ